MENRKLNIINSISSRINVSFFELEYDIWQTILKKPCSNHKRMPNLPRTLVLAINVIDNLQRELEGGKRIESTNKGNVIYRISQITLKRIL